MESKYEISVITPFHNVDMAYFKGAVRSMREQSIGFEKIQWIIVLHNCEPQYRPQLEAMLGDCPNVILVDLNNEARTPSSPRNFGVTFATAPYVGYLDGDDSYKPRCLAECVRHARETESQVVCFRRDYELENESLAPLNEIVLWNQLKERIVIEQGHWDMRRMFSGIWAFVTSKIFDRAFLLRYKIAFDEDIPYCEDSMYSMCALAQAKRICYLPQLIGYHYFINANSLVQKQSKPSHVLVAYAKGMAKIIRRAYDFGIDINEFAQVLMQHQSNFMLHSEVTPEDRETIRRTLAPFIYRTVPVPPSKIVTQEWSNYVYNLCREVILSSDEGDDGLLELRSGRLELQRILTANSDSDYGQEYHFATIQTIAAYQFHVPLSQVMSYQKLVNLQVGIGEHGILTSEKVVCYVKSECGLIPFTEAHLNVYVVAVASLLRGHHNLWVAQCELSGRLLNDRTRAHSLGSVIVRQYFFECIYGGGPRPATFSMPDELFFSSTSETNDYVPMLHYALLDREIDQIVAADAGRMAKMFSLLDTDRAGVLERLRAADADRAREVEAALAALDAGEETNFARRLWPKLRRIFAQGAGPFASERAACRRFVGDVVWNNSYVMMPEMMLGHATGDDVDQFVFDGTGCFCEFFRNDTDDISKPVVLGALEDGHTYNVIVTNGSGLYRVVTDTEIRVVRNGLDGLVFEITNQ